MFPNITLAIKNHIPQIIYYPEEGISRKMTLVDENLSDIILDISKKLEFSDDYKTLEDVLRLARESDETFIADLPDMDVEDPEFRLNETLKKHLDKVLTDLEDDYANVEMDEELKKEVNQNKKADILASILEGLYAILIAKTLIAAAELGIGTVRLDDEHKNPRLVEKMSKELEKLGIGLLLP